jgi:uncharacterized LabA/DUF88 family protein
LALSTAPRCVAFVDWSNVYLGARYGFNTRADPIRVRELLAKDRNLTHTHYFSSTTNANKGQDEFHAMLQRRGFIVHTQPLETRERKMRCGACKHEFDATCPKCQTTVTLPPHKSKMVDIDIAKHMMILCDDYDEALLVSGDKDFIPIIDWLRGTKNRRVIIHAWKGAFSGMLIGHVDGVEYLDGHISDILEPPRPRKT